ncbi:ABC transporter substrate-binding protein [Microvirga sp. W0021]|uniref:ABC transporter substrate-binding protein n=1 Tax=Hohaiivirga grylli TaxID=3133970 RepID=A0ABV0BJE8_9HYPH
MKRLISAVLVVSAVLTGVAQADRLDDIKKAGVLRVAAFDGNPPFGFVDQQSKQIIGLDVDYAKAIADKIGVKLEIRPTNPANRVPLLVSGQVDLVLANFTITEERAKQLDFSIPYFASGQQFLAKKGVLKSPDQIESLRIGADKGTTNEINLRKLYPKTVIVAYDDTPFAFTALRNGNVQAITQDGPKLVGLLANVPDKENYEIPAFTISDDYIGVGAPKGEKALVDLVNETLRELEADGRALKIYNAWFGPDSKTPLPRLFKIGDK